jgi:hypothetical protein
VNPHAAISPEFPSAWIVEAPRLHDTNRFTLTPLSVIVSNNQASVE